MSEHHNQAELPAGSAGAIACPTAAAGRSLRAGEERERERASRRHKDRCVQHADDVSGRGETKTVHCCATSARQCGFTAYVDGRLTQFIGDDTTVRPGQVMPGCHSDRSFSQSHHHRSAQEERQRAHLSAIRGLCLQRDRRRSRSHHRRVMRRGACPWRQDPRPSWQVLTRSAL